PSCVVRPRRRRRRIGVCCLTWSLDYLEQVPFCVVRVRDRHAAARHAVPRRISQRSDANGRAARATRGVDATADSAEDRVNLPLSSIEDHPLETDGVAKYDRLLLIRRRCGWIAKAGVTGGARNLARSLGTVHKTGSAVVVVADSRR